jgi:hypothetical protein
VKIRQPFDESREVPWLGNRQVEPGEVVDVPAADLPGYLEAGWEPADAVTEAAGRKLAEAGTITVLAGHTVTLTEDKTTTAKKTTAKKVKE